MFCQFPNRSRIEEVRGWMNDRTTALILRLRGEAARWDPVEVRREGSFRGFLCAGWAGWMDDDAGGQLTPSLNVCVWSKLPSPKSHYMHEIWVCNNYILDLDHNIFYSNLISASDPGWSEGGGQETWNIRGRRWRPSFFMTSFDRDRGAMAPLPPPPPPGSAAEFKWSKMSFHHSDNIIKSSDGTTL